MRLKNYSEPARGYGISASKPWRCYHVSGALNALSSVNYVQIWKWTQCCSRAKSTSSLSVEIGKLSSLWMRIGCTRRTGAFALLFCTHEFSHSRNRAFHCDPRIPLRSGRRIQVRSGTTHTNAVRDEAFDRGQGPRIPRQSANHAFHCGPRLRIPLRSGTVLTNAVLYRAFH